MLFPPHTHPSTEGYYFTLLQPWGVPCGNTTSLADMHIFFPTGCLCCSCSCQFVSFVVSFSSPRVLTIFSIVTQLFVLLQVVVSGEPRKLPDPLWGVACFLCPLVLRRFSFNFQVSFLFPASFIPFAFPRSSTDFLCLSFGFPSVLLSSIGVPTLFVFLLFSFCTPLVIPWFPQFSLVPWASS